VHALIKPGKYLIHFKLFYKEETMKPKLVYIIDNLNLAGAQVHLFNLVKGMKEIGYKDIEVISLSEGGEI
jgi:hypothetical protein